MLDGEGPGVWVVAPQRRIIQRRTNRHDLAIFTIRQPDHAEVGCTSHGAADAEGSGEGDEGQPVLAGQGANARRRPVLHQARRSIRYTEASLQQWMKSRQRLSTSEH